VELGSEEMSMPLTEVFLYKLIWTGCTFSLAPMDPFIILVPFMEGWKGEFKTSVVFVDDLDSQQELIDRGYGAVSDKLIFF
jgi:hypothetical protein